MGSAFLREPDTGSGSMEVDGIDLITKKVTNYSNRE
jgi:hypothetical protein